MQVKVLYHDLDGQDFVHVANVNVPKHQLGFNNDEIDACEYAFARTQNVFGSWSKGPQFEDGLHNEDYSENVEVIQPLVTFNGKSYGHRSSMVGDVFVVNGNVYMCKGVGFELCKEKENALISE